MSTGQELKEVCVGVAAGPGSKENRNEQRKMSNGGWEAGGGQNGFQHLAGLLNAISSQSAMCVGGGGAGGGGAVCLKDLSLSSYGLDMLKAVDYFMTQGCFLF